MGIVVAGFWARDEENSIKSTGSGLADTKLQESQLILPNCQLDSLEGLGVRAEENSVSLADLDGVADTL